MKPFIFPSITVAVLAYTAYRVTQKDLDSGVWLLTDSTLALKGDGGVAWSDISENAATASDTEGPAEGAAEGAAEVPAEFASLAKRRPEEYATVVSAFLKAYDEGRVVAMKDVVWRNYRIAN
jgi:hypothetical protein